jgi:membrane fusion protein, multidrug efflux system
MLIDGRRSHPSKRNCAPRALLIGVAALTVLAGCGKEVPKPAPPPLEVSTIAVQARDIAISAEYVAQTQSSQAVNIQARVSGFLDKRVYTEGAVVKAGQVLFRMDPKPFQAQLDAANAALQRNQAALQVATANLNRTKPLAAKNALSQKDLDDAQGQYEQAAAAVAGSKAQVDSAQLDLSYTVISSPVSGVSSYAAIADGSYLSPQNSQLTTVSVLSPMWVNFSLSENEVQRIENDIKAGRLRLPPDRNMTVEIEQADGNLFPYAGKITFADPSYNPQTGTFLIRATVDNPKGTLRPNQYVRARLRGAVRPNAILVPQRAVQQGGKGHFVWLINKEGKAELRPVTVGDWYGDGWFISEGLQVGDQLVVDGAQRLSQGAVPKVTAYVPRPDAPAVSAAAPAATISVQFATGQATLSPQSLDMLNAAAVGMKGRAGMIDITGYTDRSGSRGANVDLAKRRAVAVRDALRAAGVGPERLRLKPPLDVTGSGSDADARRVEISPGA